MNLKENALFLAAGLRRIREVGSLIPSSTATARAMTHALRAHPAPRRILEVGAGTGPITAQIVRDMVPGDHLDVYEINPDLTSYLARRFESEDAFRRVRDQVTLFTAGIETIALEPAYDVIISAIPFTAFPAATVTDFFERFRTLLRPGGTFTYIEFAGARRLMRTLARGDERERLQAVSQVVMSYAEQYEIDRHFVPANLPPALIRSLRFEA